MTDRNAVSVFPDPVGDDTSMLFPFCISGMDCFFFLIGFCLVLYYSIIGDVFRIFEVLLVFQFLVIA